MELNEYRWGIAFFDLEAKKEFIYEFGVVLLCPQRLSVLDSYSTLVRPDDPYFDSLEPVMSNGITRDELASAPTFPQIAHKVYDFLHGRIWAGHFIDGWDCPRIQEEFEKFGLRAPQDMGTIDSWKLLKERFGEHRARNLKMATLANCFDLGNQTHRSLDDVRMNIDVLMKCSMFLLLEPSLPNALITNSWFSQNDTTIPVPVSVETPSNAAVQEGSNVYDGFLEPDKVLIPFISASLVPSSRGGQKIQVLHKDHPLQLYCRRLRVIFGPNSKYSDHADRLKLNILVDPSPSLCKVLDVCDNLAKWVSVKSDSSSEWLPVVKIKNHLADSSRIDYQKKIYSSGIQLHIPYGDSTIYATEIYQRDASGNDDMVFFSTVDVDELKSLFASETLVDACFSLDVYDYEQQNTAGIRLVAKKLIIHANYSSSEYE
ncbi:hypothetical protein HHK36_007276 [Tetracentron sinense]|uniref:Exonuclease domain-containing protein n=1 Tax=Tetracentron sinense TaxID=13715 RepID=A0A834ZIN2_TETSI|nr:hypothetical protein HHK36_007276 [Tetracentron sinense]